MILKSEFLALDWIVMIDRVFYLGLSVWFFCYSIGITVDKYTADTHMLIEIVQIFFIGLTSMLSSYFYVKSCRADNSELDGE